jgi:hypothetical protein
MQKVGLFVCGCGVSFASVNLYHRLHKTVKGKDSFAEHTRSQHDKHFISGMHEPFIPSKEQHQRMSKHFALYSHMLPISLEDNTFKRAIKTPVRIRPLKECPSQNKEIKTSGLVVVGGAPALLSTAFEENITYINDQRQIPIAMGSAWHLEWDSPSEKPTSIQPIQFMKDQIRRSVYLFYSFIGIQHTNIFFVLELFFLLPLLMQKRQVVSHGEVWTGWDGSLTLKSGLKEFD